jgi:hypothetical protein
MKADQLTDSGGLCNLIRRSKGTAGRYRDLAIYFYGIRDMFHDFHSRSGIFLVLFHSGSQLGHTGFTHPYLWVRVGQ